MMIELKLKSSDNKIFNVEVDVARVSITIRQMIEHANQDEEIVPVPNVRGEILELVIKWATYHKDDPEEAEDETVQGRTDNICSWDLEFLRIPQVTLFDLIMAANYLNIKGLLDVTCKTVANMISGKSAEEIRESLNIVNDFTPEQEEQIRKENEWLKEII